MIRLELSELVGSILRPPPTEPIWEWAARNVYLDGKATATPQYWDWRQTPWCRAIMDTAQDDRYSELVVMKSSRTGVTEAALNVVRWMPFHAPGHVQYSINSADEARDIMDDRIRKPLERLIGRLEFSPEQEDAGALKIELENMRIKVTGAGSEGSFENKWLRLGILDEVEKHPINLRRGDQPTSVDLMRRRFRTVPGAKLYVIGNPGMVGGIMDREYQRGTMEVYQVPCPRCGTHFHIEHEHLEFGHCKDLADGWDLEAVAADTYIRCPHCAGRIDDRERYGMSLEGKWVGTNPKPYPRIRSMQIGDFVSNFRTIGDIALEIIQSSKTEGGRANLWNRTFGLPYEPRAKARTTDDLLLARAGAKNQAGEQMGIPYRIGRDPHQRTLPHRPAILLIAIDEQQSCLKFSVGAFDLTGALHLVDYGEVSNNDTLIREVLGKRYPIDGTDETIGIAAGWRDIGDGTKWTASLDWCLAHHDRFRIWPSRGEKPKRGPVVWPGLVNHRGAKVEIYWYQDSRLKEELYLDKLERLAEPRVWLPSDINEHPEFLHELTTEKRVMKLDAYKNPRWEWEKTVGQPNDYGDCMKMLLGMWHVVGPGLRAAAGIPQSDRGPTMTREEVEE
jgi:DNA-directed RNA polymerase subunit RPC12/RpoP